MRAPEPLKTKPESEVRRQTRDRLCPPVSAERAAEDAWFWTPEWQAGEREAEADVQEGRVKEFSSMEDLLASL